MIYLIGGATRCGKSTLARRVRKEIDGQFISGDALTHTLQAKLRTEWVPDLYVHKVDPIKEDDASVESKIERLERRDAAMWPYYEQYLKEVEKTSLDDVLIEGNVTPERVRELALPHAAVFLVDTSKDQAERLIAIRDGEGFSNNWMKVRNFSDDHIRSWALFNARHSELIKDACRAYGYTYFDLAEVGVEKAQRMAFDHLMQKTV